MLERPKLEKKVLVQLPISAQFYTVGPYLDLNMFSYDGKWISLMDTLLIITEHVQVQLRTYCAGLSID